MEKTDPDGIRKVMIEEQEKPCKPPEYLPRRLGPKGAWKPIEIGNIGGAYRAGKGCIFNRIDFKMKPLEDAFAGSGDISGKSWGSDQSCFVSRWETHCQNEIFYP